MNNFLAQLQLGATVTEKSGNAKGRTAIVRNPENGIRIYANGAMFPSQNYTDTYNLEYRADGTGNALDFFLGFDWAPFRQGAEKVGAPNMVLAAVVPKTAAKTDAFGSYRTNEKGEPTNSVMEQGSKTFGTDLIDMLTRVNDNAAAEVEKNGFLDIVFVGQLPATPDNVYKLPKMGKRGADRELGTISRKNPSIYGIGLLSEVEAEQPSEDESAA